MSILVNLTKVDDNKSKQTNLKFRIYLATLSDVDMDNWPEANLQTIESNVLLPGKTFKYLDCDVSTVVPSCAAGENPIGNKLTVTASVAGLTKKTLDWVYNNQGKEVIMIWERCSDGQKFIAGNPCSGGLVMKVPSIGKLDSGFSGISLSFEGGECPEPFYFYDATIPVAAPKDVTLGADNTIIIDTNTQYRVSSATAGKTLSDISGVTDSDVGRIIEIQGGSVNAINIAPTSKFILSNGLTFTLKDSGSISFKIIRTGAIVYSFYEVSRK